VRQQNASSGCSEQLLIAMQQMAAPPDFATAAADLLQWLDKTGTTQIMEHVGGCLCAGNLPTSGAAVPVALQVATLLAGSTQQS
jgi:hypothetical protein